MNDRVYEMNDTYKQAVADLPEAAKIRDELVAAIRTASPEKKREGRKLLVWMNEKLESAETALAEEYEAYQTMRRAGEE